MFPKDDRPGRRTDRPRRRPDRIAVEGLETRQLMAYSPFGYSLPELSVTGYAANTASWNGSLSVDVTVENQGASSLVEPLHLAPSTTNATTGVTTPTVSTADAPATSVQVYGATRPNANSGLVDLGSIAIPSVTQNSSYTTDATISLPSRPKGFPGNGGKIYLTLVVDNDQSIVQLSQALNIYRVPKAVRISNPLPDLQVVAFDIPTPLQPGDVIAPTIRIANFGSANPALQGPVTVELVASQTTTFGPGDSVVGSYVITSLPGVSGVPTQSGANGDANLIPPANEITTTLSPAKLPTSPGTYYLGIVIDPTNSIKETYAPSPALIDVVKVGPPNVFLPSGNLLVNTDGVVPVFPALPSSVIGPAPSTTPTPPVVLFPTVPSEPDRPTLNAVSSKSKKRG